MSFIHLDRNLEQMLIPITVIRGGTSRGFYFEGRNVPPQGKGLSRRAEGSGDVGQSDRHCDIPQ